jgi:hypothetical protein
MAALVVFTGLVAGDLMRLTALPAVDFECLEEDFISTSEAARAWRFQYARLSGESQ